MKKSVAPWCMGHGASTLDVETFADLGKIREKVYVAKKNLLIRQSLSITHENQEKSLNCFFNSQIT